MTAIIAVEDLTRRYRDQVALDEVSLEILEPSICGLLGRNGAGKSTLMRIIAARRRRPLDSVGERLRRATLQRAKR
jgi:ABC-2 type transport system ATP-binding protein